MLKNIRGWNSTPPKHFNINDFIENEWENGQKMNFVASTSIWELIEISGFCFGKYGLMGI